MMIWICATCGLEHPDTAQPPTSCAICLDDRQYVPTSGQSWTTHDELVPAITRIAQTVAPYRFDRLYAGFDDAVLPTDAYRIVADSLERYVGWITGDLVPSSEK